MKKQILIGALVLLATILVVFANPILNTIEAKTLDEGETLQFDVTATAPDNGTTTFSLATGAPSWASISKKDNTTATVTLSPDYEVVSGDISESFSITVNAVDADSTDSKTFEVVVNQLPLEIHDLKAYVDDEKDSGVSEDDIGTVMDIDDVYLGSELIIVIELENLFDEDDDDIDIEDIEIEAVLYDIDDGDDLEESEDIDKIKAGDKETVELVFDIPETADDDNYDLEIDIIGENEDTGEEYEIHLDFDVSVEKKSHDLRIEKAELTPSKVKCDRDAELYLKIKNLGKDEEDEVRVTVENEALGLSFSESDIEIEDDPDEPWTKTIMIDASDVEAGEYKIKTKVYYNDDNLEDAEDVILTVQECVVEEEEEEEEVVIVTPDTTQQVDTTTDSTTTTDTTADDTDMIETYETGFFSSSNLLIILLIIGIVVVVILNILMLTIAFRR